ncbi:MAG TPA: hypothetical protein VK985_14190 [Rariglobus sp.]|nr:hypothetical protein [Rariglobus sp.]
MSRLPLLLLVLGLTTTASAVKRGQTWDEVEAELGKPVSRLNAPGRSIGRWKDLEVIFVDGRAESFVKRDLATEAAAEVRRKEEAEKLRRMREELEKEKIQRDDGSETDERSRLERERKAQIEKIAALEAQLETERKRLKRLNEKTEAQSRTEAASKTELLNKEVVLLRLEIQRVLSVGEVEKASRLQRELLAKENELKVLAKDNP